MNVKEKAVKIRRKNPCLTLKEIGEACGVTKERVRQILKAEGLPTSSWGAVRVYKYEQSHLLVECRVCGKLFRKRRVYIMRTDYDYCSKECFGYWLGTNHSRGLAK